VNRQSILPLLLAWMTRLHGLVLAGQNETFSEEDDDMMTYGLRNEMTAMLGLFDQRMSELVRVWRQQRMNISAQMQCFCGGIFAHWYEEVCRSANVHSWRRSSTHPPQSQQDSNVLVELLYEESEDEDSDGDPNDNDVNEEEQAQSEEATPAQKRLKGDLDRKVRTPHSCGTMRKH
jgi:hypothetical protein